MADESPYTIDFRIVAASSWHDSDRSLSAMRQIRKSLAKRFHLDGSVPDGRVIKQWHEKLFSTGSILDLPRTGRPNETKEHAERIEASLAANPNTSIRRRAVELHLDKSSLLRYCHQEGYRAWKPTFCQFLSEDDKALRVQACEELVSSISPEEQRNFFFSDECAVYGGGKLKNAVLWSKENPHYHQQVQQHPPMVMIWGAISHDHLIGPFFIEGRMTSASYRSLLINQVFPALRELGVMETCYLQQDGAPAHTAGATRQLLDQHLSGRWVGKFGRYYWPARSPDLSSCDNALWGTVKRQILESLPQNSDDIKQAVLQSFASFTQDNLAAIHQRTWRRLALCVDLNGDQVDPYD